MEQDSSEELVLYLAFQLIQESQVTDSTLILKCHKGRGSQGLFLTLLTKKSRFAGAYGAFPCIKRKSLNLKFQDTRHASRVTPVLN
jgi:hypothetical protein